MDAKKVVMVMPNVKHPPIATQTELMKDWPKNPDGSFSTIPHNPYKLSSGSAKKVKWICHVCSHEWETKIQNRFQRGSGCGFCANLRCHSDGRNSIATLAPELMKEWRYDLNPDPLTVAAKSHKKAHWKCSTCSHEWIAPPMGRYQNGNGCKECANEAVRGKKITKREPLSEHEELLKEWDYSKNTLDPSKLTAGSTRKAHWKCRTCDNEWESMIRNRCGGAGCPYCGGGNNSLHSDGRNSLATMRPDIAAEWDYSKNGFWTPEDITYQSFKDIWFKCNTCEHEWLTKPCVRTAPTHQQGCPYCAGVALHSDGRNSVANSEKLMRQWDFFKNTEDPAKIARRSPKKLWWNCDNCGCSIHSRPQAREECYGCNQCSTGGINLEDEGFVYLMKYVGGKNGDFFKVGISTKPERRRKNLEISFKARYGSHVHIEIIDEIKMDTMREAYELESKYHSLQNCRFHSEYEIDGYTELFSEGILDSWLTI